MPEILFSESLHYLNAKAGLPSEFTIVAGEKSEIFILDRKIFEEWQREQKLVWLAASAGCLIMPFYRANYFGALKAR